MILLISGFLKERVQNAPHKLNEKRPKTPAKRADENAYFRDDSDLKTISCFSQNAF